VKKIEVEWIQVKLKIRHVQVSEFQMSKHEHDLDSKRNALYPIARNEIRQFIIPTNVTHATLDNAFAGQLPRRVLMAVVENDAENGNFTKNPFKFYHHNITQINCYCNGKELPALKPDFAGKDYIETYCDLFEELGQFMPNPTLSITHKEFGNGYSIFPFNFAPDGSGGQDGHLNPIKRGTLRFEIRLSQPVSSVLSVILFCEFDNLIQIDKDRNIVTDF
jgi:hypothetical protein